MSEKELFERLPKTVTPKNYDLFLRPNLKTFKFEGEEKVKIVINEPTKKIVLNAAELEVFDIVLTTADGTMHMPKQFLSEENETLTLELSNPLPTGEAVLKTRFNGTLNDRMLGFYRSKYTVGEEERYAAVTQFQATDARRCFPCWDEPAIKATFDITLAVPRQKVALSNMPEIEAKVEGDEKIVKFDTTPIMSTYIVAMVVGDYDYIEDMSKDGVTIRVYTPVGKKEQGRFALDCATKLLPYFKDYFQIAYPLPKMDLIAIADFSAGAMENWGLVTYTEDRLLVDPENTSTETKQAIAIIVGHELAHQWFGNLVTMEWWDGLWLNEGYAAFNEFLSVAYLFPEYDIWSQFLTDTFIPVMHMDHLKSSHPIEVPVAHPDEIEEIFDDISYNKGACIIRMLNHYIGENDFRKGMHLYLTRHQYSNTVTEDLWAALEEASRKPVGEVMSTWTKQQGYPVITVEVVQQKGNSRTFRLSQEKFRSKISHSQPDKSSWVVPISFAKSTEPSEPFFTTILREKETTVTLEDVPRSDWVKLNPGTVGYYRTKYPASMLEQFKSAIRDKSMPPLDRLGLLDDLFALVQAGDSKCVEVLKLMEAMDKEDDYTVWHTIAHCLRKLHALIANADWCLEELFCFYGLRLFKTIGRKLGWEAKPNESHLNTLLRPLVLEKLAQFGDQAVLAESRARLEKHVSGKSPIPPDLRSVVYEAVLSEADRHVYDTMIKMYKETDMHEERERISLALGSIKDRKLLMKVLDFSMSDAVRSQDSADFIVSVASSGRGRDLAWAFIKDNWETFVKRYGGNRNLGSLVKSTLENYASEERAREIEKFFASHRAPGCERSVQQICERIRMNAAWLARERDSVQEYLTRLCSRSLQQKLIERLRMPLEPNFEEFLKFHLGHESSTEKPKEREQGTVSRNLAPII